MTLLNNETTTTKENDFEYIGAKDAATYCIKCLGSLNLDRSLQRPFSARAMLNKLAAMRDLDNK